MKKDGFIVGIVVGIIIMGFVFIGLHFVFFSSGALSEDNGYDITATNNITVSTSTTSTTIYFNGYDAIADLTARVTALDGGQAKDWVCSTPEASVQWDTYSYWKIPTSTVIVQTIGKEKPEDQGDYLDCSPVPKNLQSVVINPDNQ